MNTPLPSAAVFLVDDDPSVLRAIGRLVRSAGWNVATFTSAKEFLEKQSPDAPGCLVLDVTMPGLNGLELQQALTRAGNRLPIIFLTGHGDIPMSVRAMKSGAVDFLSKPCPDEELLAAIRQALERDRQFRAERVEAQALAKLLATLTPREYEVMLGVVAGQLNKQIAAALGTVEKTIKVHRARVMQKLGVASVADLVRLTERAGVGNVNSKQ
jgi:FixJ family two-component response regulator